MSEVDYYADLCNRIEVKGSKYMPFIMQRLMTTEQARLCWEMPGLPEELAAKVGRELKDVQKDLDDLYRKGIATPSSRSGKYNFPRSFGLFVDKVNSHNAKFLPFLGPDYSDLWQKFFTEQESHFFKGITPRAKVGKGEGTIRIISAYLAVKDMPELKPYDNVKAILEAADKIAICHCQCKSTNRKKTCQVWTDEHCFMLNKDAQYMVDSGAGRFVTVDEALAVFINCEQQGLVHTAGNTRNVEALLCNCCPDCCMGIKSYFKYGNEPMWQHASRFQSVIDPKLCDGCGICVGRCVFKSISMQKDASGNMKAVKDTSKCYGAGLCAVKCPQNAITMKCVHTEDWIPRGLYTRPGETRVATKPLW
jgi:NAD-dependent dihydropyrimidine dehydrogenase PreA subunit